MTNETTSIPFNEFGACEIKMPLFMTEHIRYLFDTYDHNMIIDGRSATIVLNESKALLFSPADDLPANSFLQVYFVNDTSHLFGDHFHPIYHDRKHSFSKVMLALNTYDIPLTNLSLLTNKQFCIDLQKSPRITIIDIPATIEFLKLIDECFTDKVLYFRIATASSRYSIFLELGHSVSPKTHFSVNRIIYDNSTGKIVHKQWRLFRDRFKTVFISIISSYDVLDIYTLEGFYRALSTLHKTYSVGNDSVLNALTSYDLEYDQKILHSNQLRVENSRNRHQSTWTM